ncbi:hypothetical protein NDA16_004602 [Ustilago loliicola]|nr:hypothetical protein NDA16_004602 [Ustilago loliicola]
MGLVLGISGFFHSTVASALKTVQTNDRTSNSTAATATQPIFPLVARYFTTGIFLGGLVLGLARSRVEAGLGVSILDSVHSGKQVSLLTTAALGALVGFGTKLGNGCTSGHFLCGLSRLSLRSVAATATFFGVAVLTHVSNLSKAAVQVPGATSTFASHLPASFTKPSISTLLTLQTPALVYLVAPRLLGAISSQEDTKQKSARQLLAAKIMALAVGVHFSFALGISGMTKPSKVLGFLSLSPRLISSGVWDPSLAMVAIGGIIPASIAYFNQVKPKQDELRRLSTQTTSKKADKSDAHFRPQLSLVSPEWKTPANPYKIDARLIIGSILFGLGWGATGLCPGPALTSLSALGTEVFAHGSLSSVSELLIFVASMAAGGQVAGRF